MSQLTYYPGHTTSYSVSHCGGPCQLWSRPAYSASHCTNSTPRVTVVGPVSGHRLSGHTLHTPRVTVEVPVSCHSSHTTLVNKIKLLRRGVLSSTCVKQAGSNPLSLSQHKNKTKKCQPADRDTLATGHTLHSVGVGVPVRGLARQKSNYLLHVTLVKNVKQTKSCSQLSVLYSSICLGLSSYNPHFYNTMSKCTIAGYSHFISSKLRNKSIKQVNGNGKNSLLVSHWNLGSKKWCNKRNQILCVPYKRHPPSQLVTTHISKSYSKLRVEHK